MITDEEKSLQRERKKWLADFLMSEYRKWAAEKFLNGENKPKQSDFAEEIGLDSQTFSHLVTRARKPSQRTLEILVKKFGKVISVKFGIKQFYNDPDLNWLADNWEELKQKSDFDNLIDIAKQMLDNGNGGETNLSGYQDKKRIA